MPPLPSTPRPVARIVCRIGPGGTRTMEIRGEEALLGRDSDVAVPLPTGDVSRQHARISWDGRSYWVEDLKSTNGTFVNGRRVTRERLRDLSVITLGKDVDLVFLVRSGEIQTVRKQGILRATIASEGEALPREIGVGELTIGRSPACNIVSERADVSKVHARLERTAEELWVRDLGSANGTFVNGARVTHAALRDRDVIRLGFEESYQISLEMGEVTTSASTIIAGTVEVPAEPSPTVSRPRFSSDWKARFEWSAPDAQKDAVAGPERTAPPTVLATLTLPGIEKRPTMQVRLRGQGFDVVATGAGAHDLGRAREAGLRIDHPSVSRRHARIVISEDLGSAFVQDQGGSNGTRLNGVLVQKSEVLSDDAVIKVGDVELLVSLLKG